MKGPASIASLNQPLADLNLYCEKRPNCYDRPIKIISDQPTSGALSGVGFVDFQLTPTLNKSVTLATCVAGPEHRAFVKLDYLDSGDASVQQVSYVIESKKGKEGERMRGEGYF